MKTIDKIKRAKIQLINNEPFFGQLSCFLNPIEQKECPTMGVNDKGDLFYNPKFVDSLSERHLLGVMVHEIMHLAYLHPSRLGNRNHMIFNIAADIKINNDILNKFDLPEETIKPEYNKVKIGDIEIKDINEKSTEQIYEELKQKAKKVKMSGSGKIETGSGEISKDLVKPEQGNGKKAEETKEQWKGRVQSALQNANKQQGNIPAGIKRIWDKLENPQKKWSTIIRERLLKAKYQRTWKKPNKKWLPYYFQGKKKNKTLRAFIAIDTSGSMSDKEFKQTMSEIWGLANEFKEFKLYITSCDYEMYDVHEVNQLNKSKIKTIKMQGGGGTRFTPVFDYIKKKYHDNVDCLIYFTDGYGDFPSEKPRYNTYWVITHESRDIEIPFGKRINLRI